MTLIFAYPIHRLSVSPSRSTFGVSHVRMASLRSGQMQATSIEEYILPLTVGNGIGLDSVKPARNQKRIVKYFPTDSSLFASGWGGFGPDLFNNAQIGLLTSGPVNLPCTHDPDSISMPEPYSMTMNLHDNHLCNLPLPWYPSHFALRFTRPSTAHISALDAKSCYTVDIIQHILRQ